MLHAVHQPDMGVTISGTVYELVMPINTTSVTVISKPDAIDYKVRLMTIGGDSALVILHGPANEFSLIEFLENCPTEVNP